MGNIINKISNNELFLGNISINETEVPIYVKSYVLATIDKEILLTQKVLTDWKECIEQSLIIEKIVIDKIWSFKKGSNKANFMSIEVNAKDYRERFVPGYVFLRGPAVAILFLIQDEYGNKFIIETEQARLPIGQAACRESPAGMIDKDNNICGTAISEVKEEIGIEDLNESDLVKLGSYWSSQGGIDEQMHCYLLPLKMKSKDIATLQGKNTGIGEDEKEYITVVVSKYDGNFKSTDSKTLAMQTFYKNLQDSGKRITFKEINLK